MRMKERPVLEHRNWIVIADSSYPAQTSAGIETIATNEDHFNTTLSICPYPFLLRSISY